MIFGLVMSPGDGKGAKFVGQNRSGMEGAAVYSNATFLLRQGSRIIKPSGSIHGLTMVTFPRQISVPTLKIGFQDDAGNTYTVSFKNVQTMP
jgi:hypothetical protein